jgi:flagellar motility protein MotE (MotC chaperone)
MNPSVRKPRPKLDRAVPADAGRGPAFRILPAVIVAAVCLLGLRIQVVVSDFASNQSGASVAVEQSKALAQAQPAAENADKAVDKEAAGDMDKPAEGAPMDGKEKEETEAAEGAAAEPMAFKPSELTKSEIDTLQRLSERREVIERRERELQQKESLVKAAEQRLDQKISQMQEIEKQLQGLVQQYDAKKKTEIEQLVKIYTAMKPKDAARIFDQLDMTILVSVVTSMKENKVAPILSLMDAEKARQLTEELSTRRQLPGANPGQQG